MYGGHSYRTRDPVKVVDEICWLVEQSGFRSFYIDDDTTNIGKQRMLKLADELGSRRVNVPWAMMARADTSDEETYARLREAGMVAIKFGVESGVQSLVDACGKQLDLNKVRRTVKFLKSLGVRIHLTFAFGLPGETVESVRRTIEFAFELDPFSIQFSIITPFPGSSHFRMAEEKGQLVTYDWEKYDGYHCAVICTDALSEKQLEELHQQAVRRWELHVARRRTIRGLRTLRGWKHLGRLLTHPLKMLNNVRQLRSTR
jgi:radical SAM superfamily enzyme YgiQ (UPF0313 family)